MAEDSSEIFVAGDGHIYLAPFGTTLPNSIDDTLNAAFEEAGYLTPEGFRMTPNLTTFEIDGWQAPDPLRSGVDRRTVVLSLDFLQSNENVFMLYFGGGSFTSGVYTAPDGSEVDERSLVADVLDGSRSWRFWFPKVSLAASRTVSFVRSDAAKWGVDLNVQKASGEGLFGADMSDDAEFPPYPD